MPQTWHLLVPGTRSLTVTHCPHPPLGFLGSGLLPLPAKGTAGAELGIRLVMAVMSPSPVLLCSPRCVLGQGPMLVASWSINVTFPPEATWQQVSPPSMPHVFIVLELSHFLSPGSQKNLSYFSPCPSPNPPFFLFKSQLSLKRKTDLIQLIW